MTQATDSDFLGVSSNERVQVCFCANGERLLECQVTERTTLAETAWRLRSVLQGGSLLQLVKDDLTYSEAV